MRSFFLLVLGGLITVPTAASSEQGCQKEASVQTDSVPRHGCGTDPFSLRPDSPFSDELNDKFKKGFEAPIEGNVAPRSPSNRAGPKIRSPGSL
ncbi:hypothetical protein [Bradyrhizobium mercantei]|uniref:hypothetical protein n=1 Tax=Bradyrhizobium mercantei TaxID=1904807 RepID=UPI0011785D55|nr:hypothetical protein [Bradyrhizobium mercantei]